MGLVRSKQEIKPCPGPTRERGCQFERAADANDLRLKGYDDVWRCVHCTRIHTELTFDATPIEPDAAKRLQAQVRARGGHMTVEGKDD